MLRVDICSFDCVRIWVEEGDDENMRVIYRVFDGNCSNRYSRCVDVEVVV